VWSLTSDDAVVHKTQNGRSNLSMFSLKGPAEAGFFRLMGPSGFSP